MHIALDGDAKREQHRRIRKRGRKGAEGISAGTSRKRECISYSRSTQSGGIVCIYLP